MRTPPGQESLGRGAEYRRHPFVGEKVPMGSGGRRRRRCRGRDGRKHLSRAEEAQRRAGEVNLSTAKTARPPSWLPEEPKELKKSFRALGRQLIEAKLFTELDRDTLGR